MAPVHSHKFNHATSISTRDRTSLNIHRRGNQKQNTSVLLWRRRRTGIGASLRIKVSVIISSLLITMLQNVMVASMATHTPIT